MKSVLMLAAENGAISGAKVGGMADVIRDLPKALMSQKIKTDVIMPSYGFLAQSSNAQILGSFTVSFAGETFTVTLFSLLHPKVASCKIYFVEHDKLTNDQGSIYYHGQAYRPFAEDATKFAFFCQCVATALKAGMLELPDCVHLHDWHMGMFALLRAFDPHYLLLQAIPCVFSIHNLALQGIRPLDNDPDALATWYPELYAGLSAEQKSQIIDVNFLDCINPMRAAIRLSNKVHLVSKSYAKEVVKPSNHHMGFFGGEGLEADLRLKKKQGQLVGILNACVYDEPELPLSEPLQSALRREWALLSHAFSAGTSLKHDDCDENTLLKPQDLEPKKRSTSLAMNPWQSNCAQWQNVVKLLVLIEQALLFWGARRNNVSPIDSIALHRISSLWRQLQMGWQPDFLMTSVGRLTDQKVLILRQPSHSKPNAVSVLEALLVQFSLARPNGLFVFIGSGDERIAQEFKMLAAKYHQFIFLDGYDETLADCLFRSGDLFLMPSSFEPCGISQMLAMRQGQICLVHGVGGLKDTVSSKTGFVFKGAGLKEQIEQLLTTFDKAMACIGSRKWQTMQRNAKKQRFLWSDIAMQYKTDLYGFSHDKKDKSEKVVVRRVK
ncbi:glycogen synthase [uncultured Shewanella sp.]|uniref:glycogen synthase n=1 Tax=uncultured Shewanella sp. TaxID=173975 RepID=UPI002613EEB9|nr:glycogen/starch synthase [uncultured Shewanella sp.]